MVLSTPSCCRKSDGCLSIPSVLSGFSPGSLLFSQDDSCLSSVFHDQFFGFIIHRKQLSTPRCFDSLHFSPPCPFLPQLFFCIIVLNPQNWCSLHNLLQASHSQSNVLSQPLIFLIDSLLHFKKSLPLTNSYNAFYPLLSNNPFVSSLPSLFSITFIIPFYVHFNSFVLSHFLKVYF